MPWTVLDLLLGLVTLVLGAETLVRGAARLAQRLGISSLVIGLTVVAFGTSFPELAVSVQAARLEKADIAVGNVVGSNIFNVLCILGVSALIVPLQVNRQLVRLDVPVMLAVSLLLWLLASDGHLSFGDGVLLLASLAGYTSCLVCFGRRTESGLREKPASSGRSRGLLRQAGLIVLGLVLLVLGARWLVDAAATLARSLGADELVIGVTIVAAGTSLPEVATSVLAAARKETDLAVGNVVGSNTFNILGILGAAAVASEGLDVREAALAFEIPILSVIAFACLPVFFTEGRIARWEGGLFLGYYAAYTVYVVLRAREHAALPVYAGFIAFFAVPLTVITLAVSFLAAAKERRRAGRGGLGSSGGPKRREGGEDSG